MVPDPEVLDPLFHRKDLKAASLDAVLDIALAYQPIRLHYRSQEAPWSDSGAQPEA